MIEQQITEFVAAADWTDDLRVRVELKKRITTLTITQARELAAELVAAADTAESASDERTQPENAGFDVEHIGRDCADGKHTACIGDAWSVKDDAPTPCTCHCHLWTISEEQSA